VKSVSAAVVASLSVSSAPNVGMLAATIIAAEALQAVLQGLPALAALGPPAAAAAATTTTGAGAGAAIAVPPSRAQLHVSGAILQEMPYFQTRLSSRWDQSKDMLYVRLPEGCSIAAASMLFERLHFPSGHWGQVDLGTVLQIIQLAGMFLAEGDGLLKELARLLRANMRNQGDIDTVIAFVARVDAPACIAELASRLSRRKLSTLLGEEELTGMLKNVLASGDGSTAEAVEKILAQRSRRDSDSTKRNASVLQSVLQVGPATDCESLSGGKLTNVHSESAGRWSEWVERPAPGLQHILQITTKFVLAQPEYLGTLAPLMFPKFPVNPHWTRSALVTDMLKRTIRTLLDGCFLQGSIGGHGPSPSGGGAEGGAAVGSGQAEHEGVSALVSAVIANGHEDLLHANSSLAAAVSRAACISSATVESLCSALLSLKSTTLSSLATAEMLRSICGPSRQKLCLAILPNMHTLRPEVKAALLLEVDADDSGSEGEVPGVAPRGFSWGASAEGGAAKRQRS